MQTRIVFNGQEYAGLDQMPEDVRKAFQDALAKLTADADRDGLPDVLEGQGSALGTAGSSITINGRPIEDIGKLSRPLQWLVRSMLDYTVREAAGNLAAVAPPTPEQARLLRSLDATRSVLGSILRALSAGAALVVIVVGVWMIVHMDPASRSQGGGVYLGILVAMGVVWLVGSLIGLIRRTME
jgi:hypothetical protein